MLIFQRCLTNNLETPTRTHCNVVIHFGFIYLNFILKASKARCTSLHLLSFCLSQTHTHRITFLTDLLMEAGRHYGRDVWSLSQYFSLSWSIKELKCPEWRGEGGTNDLSAVLLHIEPLFQTKVLNRPLWRALWMARILNWWTLQVPQSFMQGSCLVSQNYNWRCRLQLYL